MNSARFTNFKEHFGIRTVWVHSVIFHKLICYNQLFKNTPLFYYWSCYVFLYIYITLLFNTYINGYYSKPFFFHAIAVTFHGMEKATEV